MDWRIHSNIWSLSLWSNFLLTVLFASPSDRESSPVRVLHTREGAVWRRGAEAGGATPPLVQHGDHAGPARDAGEHQGGDPTSGESTVTKAD